MNLERCRLCLESNHLLNLFRTSDVPHDNRQDPPLPDKIRKFALIKLSENDGLPTFICQTCEHKVNLCYSFKILIEDTEQQLRHALPAIKTEPTESHSADNIKNEPFKPSESRRDVFKFVERAHRVEHKSKKRKKKIKSTAKWTEDEEKKPIKDFITPPAQNKLEVLVKEVKLEDGLDNSDNFFTHNDDNSDSSNAKEIKIESTKDLKANENQKTQCESCGRIFKTISILKKHVFTHTLEKLFPCSLCAKKYTRAEHLMVHMRTHMGIKPCVCEICGRAFTKKQDLFRHQRIHSDEKNFPCSQCDRKFKRSADVHVHMRSHTGARPYVCKLCSKSYTSRSGLVKHNRRACTSPEPVRTLRILDNAWH